jgi:hypothetical protein
MKSIARIMALLVLAAGTALLGSQASLAAADWSAVVAQHQNAKSYTLLYDYVGPRGKFFFQYAIVDPASKTPKVRTQILRGSDKNVGTVIIYDPDVATDKVKAKVGLGYITRALTHKDVDNTPFYQSIYGMILREVSKYGKPTVKGTQNYRGVDCTVFQFGSGGDTYTVFVDANNSIIHTEKRQGGKIVEERYFHDIQWNSNPTIAF